MMMVDVIKLTKEGVQDRNKFQCYHNNLSYCRFREKCSVGINTILMFVPKVFVEIKDALIDIPKHASMGINASFK